MNLTAQDWEEFRKLFPGAAAFIDGRSLHRERENLQREVDSGRLQMDPRRKVWVEARLAELNTLFADIQATV